MKKMAFQRETDYTNIVGQSSNCISHFINKTYTHTERNKQILDRAKIQKVKNFKYFHKLRVRMFCINFILKEVI